MSPLSAILAALLLPSPQRRAAWLPKTRRHLAEMLRRNWHLGLSSFGGPAVHFQIFNRLFVDRWAWVDVQTYQELFAICQALPGPASTKMLFGLNVIRGGFLSAVLAFFVWSLPGALGMYGLALGVARISEALPAPVYALLSGLNAATVGIVALAAVQLAQKAVTDRLTRVLVFAGGTVGMLYNALWYFPALMSAAALVTVVWDARREGWWRGRGGDVEEAAAAVPLPESSRASQRSVAAGSLRRVGTPVGGAAQHSSEQDRAPAAPATSTAPPATLIFNWRFGLSVIGLFFVAFIPIMVLRGVLRNSSARPFKLFANFYLAGTIIFGGGPVVIPLLREYIVAEGWVTPRDFLLGLAIIQAFPGPNFNFAVYLGALASYNLPPLNSATGALIGYLGIFLPGLILFIGTIGIWRSMRRKRWVTSSLRGVNAAAVGLVYTAVYRLWRIGFVDRAFQAGASLEQDPWWVAVAATSFVGGMWFDMAAPVAILLGGAMGMLWFAVVKT
ncbi:MAG: hypothetical protein M1839_003341 [Geoglossum umbratile]|nr:MAG: hypothetical protein M1839_003341 [Geoglossum umbratile]